VLKLKCAWEIFSVHFCGNYFFYFMLAWLLNYLVGEQKMSIGEMSQFGTLRAMVIPLDR
jgi:hypothetical protein